jgi:[methyl-Co(III) methylamine-specific corrinoid protein]:coenzyme M methyltransferase
MAIMTDEEFATALMDLATEFNIAYAKKMAENGADTMVIIDPTASAMLIGDAYYEKYVVPAHRKIVDAMHEMNVPVVIHICGDTTMSLELMESSGVDAISVDQSVDIATAKSKVNKAMIIGNLDPVAVLWKGTPDTIREVSQKAINAGVDLLAPGCGIVSKTPSANLQAMVGSAKNRKY